MLSIVLTTLRITCQTPLVCQAKHPRVVLYELALGRLLFHTSSKQLTRTSLQPRSLEASCTFPKRKHRHLLNSNSLTSIVMTPKHLADIQNQRPDLLAHMASTPSANQRYQRTPL